MSPKPVNTQSLTYGKMLVRSMRLRCPSCGKGKLFSGWFRMLPTCDVCGRKHDRAPGFFLGSIYFNYGVTAVLVSALYLGLRFGTEIAPKLCLAAATIVSILFPIWFFRHARALWAGFDEMWDPWEKSKR